MSIEAVLMMVVFVVLPLIQQLLQRSRQQDDPAPAATPRPQVHRPHLPADVPQRPAPSVPPKPVPRRQLSQARTTALDQPLPIVSVIHTRTPKPPQIARRRHSIVHDIRNPAGFRRAIVLKTVLEECRAAKPYE